MDPVICFFLLGLGAGVLRTNLKFPEGFFEALSLYLLIGIGLKGGASFSGSSLSEIVLPVLGTLALGILIPIVAFLILTKVLKFGRSDSAAIAAHYGSVSVVTFAVVQTYLDQRFIAYEAFMSLLVVILEVPAIAVGVFLGRPERSKIFSVDLLREVVFNKSIYLLLGGLVIAASIDPSKLKVLSPLFFDPFKGVLAFFLMEMGLLVSRRLKDLRRVGVRLICFAVVMPLISASLGAFIAHLLGLSLGGGIILATLAASSSYIAAPAAVRLAIPEANPTLYLTASLGVTFPFNIFIGIPLYTSVLSRLWT